MKVLVFGDQLVVGGSQVNAIELSAALRDLHGHEIIYFATPGPMVKLVEEKGLRFFPAPEASVHPSPARMRALREVVHSERPDLIHVWDWWQCLDAFYAVHLPMRIPILVSHMMMELSRVLPKRLPTTYGTPELRDLAQAAGRRPVEVLLPPVDVRLNAPDAADPGPFRRRWGIEKGDITLVTVSRLHSQLKSESLFRTLDAVRLLGPDLPLRFLIVGDGEIRAKLERLAEEINYELGRPAVVLTGALLDPRPAYAAADIVIGMGGSALRGMAFAKPVVIVGEQGFAATFTPENADFFYYNGIYGRGSVKSDEPSLTKEIRWLAEHPDQFRALGDFSRQFVVRNFSLEAVSAHLSKICQAAIVETPRLGVATADGFRTAAIGLIERKAIPYWTVRKAYRDLGGPPILPAIREVRNRLCSRKGGIVSKGTTR
jgi:L-malate glycosyltransferase